MIPGQFKGVASFMSFFSAFWLAVVGAVTFGAIKQGIDGSLTHVLGTAIFLLVGLMTGGMALFGVFGRTTLQLTPETVELTSSLAAFRRARRVPTSAITSIGQSMRYEVNDSPVYSVDIHVGAQRLKLGTGLEPAEQDWLIRELEAFVERVK